MGSGKSTLLAAILAELSKEWGDVEIRDLDKGNKRFANCSSGLLFSGLFIGCHSLCFNVCFRFWLREPAAVDSTRHNS